MVDPSHCLISETRAHEWLVFRNFEFLHWTGELTIWRKQHAGLEYMLWPALAAQQHSSPHKYENTGPQRTTSDRSMWNNWTKTVTQLRLFLYKGASVIAATKVQTRWWLWIVQLFNDSRSKVKSLCVGCEAAGWWKMCPVDGQVWHLHHLKVF